MCILGCDEKGRVLVLRAYLGGSVGGLSRNGVSAGVRGDMLCIHADPGPARGVLSRLWRGFENARFDDPFCGTNDDSRLPRRGALLNWCKPHAFGIPTNGCDNGCTGARVIPATVRRPAINRTLPPRSPPLSPAVLTTNHTHTPVFSHSPATDVLAPPPPPPPTPIAHTRVRHAPSRFRSWSGPRGAPRFSSSSGRAVYRS